MKNVIIAVFFLLFALSVTAQTISIDYIEGKVEALSNSKWIKIVSGDIIEANSSVKLFGGSLLEFEYNGSIISIVEEGTYSIKALISSSKEVKSWNLFDIVGSKIAKTLGNSEDQGGSAALGVRGHPSEVEGMDWVLEDNDTNKLSLAKVYITQEKYAEAISLLDDYSASAQANEMKEIRYYLAYAHAMIGETAIALQQVNKSAITSDDPLYPDFVLLKGKLLLEGLSNKRALALFEEYLGRTASGPTAQKVLILESYCYKGTGDKEKQKDSLGKAEKLDPSSPEGAQARKLLNALK